MILEALVFPNKKVESFNERKEDNSLEISSSQSSKLSEDSDDFMSKFELDIAE